MLTPEHRFVNDVDALREILKNPTTENLLSSSVILRRMFIDSTPLVHRVAKGRDEKLIFKLKRNVVDEFYEGMPVKDGLEFLMINTNFINSAETNELKLDAFLKSKIAFSGGVMFTIYDVVMFAANNAGGVHYDPPGEGHKYKMLGSKYASIEVNGVTMSLAPLVQISRLALDALGPLYHKLRI